MRKRYFRTLMTALVMTGLLAGCGNTGNTVQDKSVSEPAEPAETAETEESSSDSNGSSDENSSESADESTVTTDNGEKYLIKYATVRSSDHGVEQLVQEYFDRLTEESGGRLEFECYWDGSMGSAREIAESGYAGTIDAFWGGSGDLTVYAPVAEILTNPPFVYKDDEHAARVLDAVWDDVDAMIESTGFKPLYHSYQGTRQLISKNPVETLEDMAGLKKRTLNTEYFLGLFRTLGADPAALDVSELYTALQTGVVEAGGGDLAMIYTKGWHEVVKNLTMYNAICVQGIPVMNLEKFNSLPEDLQQLMLDVGKDMVIRGNEEVGKSEEEYLQKLESEGVNVIYPTEEAMEQFREAVADYAAEYSKSLGDDVYAVYEKMIAVE